MFDFTCSAVNSISQVISAHLKEDKFKESWFFYDTFGLVYKSRLILIVSKHNQALPLRYQGVFLALCDFDKH